MAKELQKRSEVKVEDTWKLSDMYENIEAWEKELTEITKLSEELAALEGKTMDSAETLLKVLEYSAQLGQKLELAYNYAERLYDQDTAESKHQAMAAKVSGLYAIVSEKAAFIDPEILIADEKQLENYLQTLPALELYRKQVEEIQRTKEHSLSTEMEKLLAMSREMAQTATDTYSVLNNAEMEFPETTDEDGEQVRITNGRFIPLVQSSNREVRKEAFEKYYSTYQKFLHTYASLYYGQVKQLCFYAKARKYASNLEASVDRNNVSPKVYQILIDTVNKNLDKMHRYVALRKKILGIEELHMYDIYPTIVADVEKKYTFEEAKQIVLEALEPMGEEYLSKVREGFENRWIDVYENKGKRGGAYSAGVYGTHPYVLLNFNGSLDSVFTLIHEMGHAIHSYYSNQTQPYIYADYKIFVAEVASTCNEVLLLEYLLKKATDVKERAYLLNHYLDMFKGTLFRQTQFAEFELTTNRMVEEGDSLNADNLSELYLEINKKYYGETMISDDLIAYEWARIPHFYYNFYVYQYATSFSAAVAIAHDILHGGEPVVKKYIEFLSSGCTASPVELLRMCGLDMETEEPIQNALNVMAEVLDEMDSIAEDIKK